ncbi:MAG: glycosyltransferase family 39 protein, partial [Rhodospirillales bacterium]|nr:glycosyltransferase family 39 protein [Rhodospirillales bacterium]
MATGATALLFLACVGVGATTLRAIGVLEGLRRGERLPWSFALGIGLLGWITFFPAAFGLIAPLHLAILCLACASGLYFLFRAGFMPQDMPNLDRTSWILFAAVAIALAFDLLEGVSPPADADSLAYHFALPKQFLAAGRLEFVPRAADGAAPMLLHMTYLIALGLGGETTLTLWAMVSGWMPALLVFALSRRYLDFNWSLSVALIFLTTPAVLYGGGSGQMETRLALFALCAAFAVGDALRSGGIRYVVLAGMFAGFFGGAKFTGLIFIAACGAALLLGRRRVPHG